MHLQKIRNLEGLWIKEVTMSQDLPNTAWEHGNVQLYISLHISFKTNPGALSCSAAQTIHISFSVADDGEEGNERHGLPQEDDKGKDLKDTDCKLGTYSKFGWMHSPKPLSSHCPWEWKCVGTVLVSFLRRWWMTRSQGWSLVLKDLWLKKSSSQTSTAFPFLSNSHITSS